MRTSYSAGYRAAPATAAPAMVRTMLPKTKAWQGATAHQ